MQPHSGEGHQRDFALEPWLVKEEHAHLQASYASIYETEEQERTKAWRSFLSQHAHDFSSRSERDGPSSLEALALLGLEVVINVVNAGHQHEREHLQQLVHAGVPAQIRGMAWKAFLDISVRRMRGYYGDLVRQVLGELGTKLLPLTADEIRHQAALTSLLDEHASPPPQSQQPASSAAPSPDSEDPGSASKEALLGGASGAEGPSSGQGKGPAAPSWSTHGQAWLQQIEKDLPRTFPGHPSMQAAGRAALRRVLAAYALRNPAVGYCQGLNFIVGVLLMHMEEEDAFYCLCTVIEDVLPGHYSTDMMATQIDARIFTHLCRDEFPLVSRHMSGLGADMSCVVVVQWFLVLFVNHLPLETCLRVWDCLFYHRSDTVLFQVALALVEIYSAPLLHTVDEIDAFQVVQSLALITFDSSRLVSVACSSFPAVTARHIAALHEQYRQQIRDEAEAGNATSAGPKQGQGQQGQGDGGAGGPKMSMMKKLMQRLERGAAEVTNLVRDGGSNGREGGGSSNDIAAPQPQPAGGLRPGSGTATPVAPSLGGLFRPSSPALSASGTASPPAPVPPPPPAVKDLIDLSWSPPPLPPPSGLYSSKAGGVSAQDLPMQLKMEGAVTTPAAGPGTSDASAAQPVFGDAPSATSAPATCAPPVPGSTALPPQASELTQAISSSPSDRQLPDIDDLLDATSSLAPAQETGSSASTAAPPAQPPASASSPPPAPSPSPSPPLPATLPEASTSSFAALDPASASPASAPPLVSSALPARPPSSSQQLPKLSKAAQMALEIARTPWSWLEQQASSGSGVVLLGAGGEPSSAVPPMPLTGPTPPLAGEMAQAARAAAAAAAAASAAGTASSPPVGGGGGYLPHDAASSGSHAVAPPAAGLLQRSGGSLDSSVSEARDDWVNIALPSVQAGAAAAAATASSSPQQPQQQPHQAGMAQGSLHQQQQQQAASRAEDDHGIFLLSSAGGTSGRSTTEVYQAAREAMNAEDAVSGYQQGKEASGRGGNGSGGSGGAIAAAAGGGNGYRSGGQGRQGQGQQRWGSGGASEGPGGGEGDVDPVAVDALSEQLGISEVVRHWGALQQQVQQMNQEQEAQQQQQQQRQGGGGVGVSAGAGSALEQLAALQARISASAAAGCVGAAAAPASSSSPSSVHSSPNQRLVLQSQQQLLLSLGELQRTVAADEERRQQRLAALEQSQVLCEVMAGQLRALVATLVERNTMLDAVMNKQSDLLAKIAQQDDEIVEQNYRIRSLESKLGLPLGGSSPADGPQKFLGKAVTSGHGQGAGGSGMGGGGAAAGDGSSAGNGGSSTSSSVVAVAAPAPVPPAAKEASSSSSTWSKMFKRFKKDDDGSD